MNITIESIKHHPQHLDQVAGWVFSEWGNTFAGSSLEAIRERIAKRMREDEIPLTLVALEESELVGTVSIKINDMDTRPELTPWLAGVYVKDEARGRGIGSIMVAGAEEKAVKLGIQKLYLFTPSRRAFYERMGWSFMEDTEYHGERVTLMSKNLS